MASLFQSRSEADEGIPIAQVNPTWGVLYFILVVLAYLYITSSNSCHNQTSIYCNHCPRNFHIAPIKGTPMFGKKLIENALYDPEKPASKYLNMQNHGIEDIKCPCVDINFIVEWSTALTSEISISS